VATLPAVRPFVETDNGGGGDSDGQSEMIIIHNVISLENATSFV